MIFLAISFLGISGYEFAIFLSSTRQGLGRYRRTRAG
jgi:hypothetical protein